MNSPGGPVPLMSHQGDGFKVNLNAFDDILRQSDLLHRKLVVISIVGEYRKGKSFFLNYVMRYLYNQGKKENWINDDIQSRLPGFSWRQGLDRETDGIVMWSQAFPIGSEYAVILLDTEGTYDEQATNKTMSHLFACSALISSLQIFNVPERITKQTMQEIQAFAEFGRLASCSGSQHAFQDLLFLVRDWIYENDYAFGTQGGQGHLDRWLRSDRDGVKDTLALCYNKSSCYLMPSPGDKVIKDPRFQGNTSDMDPQFAFHLQNVIELIFSREYMQPRKIGGKPLYVRDFMKYFTLFAKSLNDSGVEPTTLFQSQVQVCNNNAKQAALEHYREKMDTVTDGEEPRDDLFELHESTAEEALSIFDEQPKMGGEQHATTYRNILVHDMQICYSKYLNIETHKRVMKSKIDDKEKELWEAENKRLMDELQHKQDIETQRLETLALEKKFEAEQLAKAEEYKQQLHSLEQKAAADRMMMQHEFQLKMDEMKRRADVSREEMERAMKRHAEELEEAQKKLVREVENAKNNQESGNPFLGFLEGVASILTLPLTGPGTLLRAIFKGKK